MYQVPGSVRVYGEVTVEEGVEPAYTSITSSFLWSESRHMHTWYVDITISSIVLEGGLRKNAKIEEPRFDARNTRGYQKVASGFDPTSE